MVQFSLSQWHRSLLFIYQCVPRIQECRQRERARQDSLKERPKQWNSVHVTLPAPDLYWKGRRTSDHCGCAVESPYTFRDITTAWLKLKTFVSGVCFAFLFLFILIPSAIFRLLSLNPYSSFLSFIILLPALVSLPPPYIFLFLFTLLLYFSLLFPVYYPSCFHLSFNDPLSTADVI